MPNGQHRENGSKLSARRFKAFRQRRASLYQRWPWLIPVIMSIAGALARSPHGTWGSGWFGQIVDDAQTALQQDIIDN